MHPDLEAIQRLLHGELAAADAASVRDHLARCADCSQRWEAARGEEAQVFGLLQHLDEAAPVANLGAVLRRARRPAWPLRRLAATLILSAGLATAAYAVPGSPLPRWLARVGHWIATPAPVPPKHAPLPVPGSSGIVVEPGDLITIDFVAAQDSGQVTVRLGDGTALMATALGPGAAFETAPGRLVIQNQGARIGYEIVVPRAAPSVELRVAGRTLFLKRGAGIEFPAPADTGGSYQIPLAPGRDP